MGWVDADHYYQEMMTGVLNDLIYRCVLQYLDDGLIFAKDEATRLDVCFKGVLYGDAKTQYI